MVVPSGPLRLIGPPCVPTVTRDLLSINRRGWFGNGWGGGAGRGDDLGVGKGEAIISSFVWVSPPPQPTRDLKSSTNTPEQTPTPVGVR